MGVEGVIGQIVIDDVRPRTPSGLFPAKSSVGEIIPVSADIFTDGHVQLGAQVRWRCSKNEKSKWLTSSMQHRGNDRWESTIQFSELGIHEVVVDAWVDRFATWRHDVALKWAAGEELGIELIEVSLILEKSREQLRGNDKKVVDRALKTINRISCDLKVRVEAALDSELAIAVAGCVPEAELVSSLPSKVWVDRARARFSSWYEMFPRSEGGFVGSAKRLSAIAEMGFDIVYFPPIHPIGETFRKGRNNTLKASPDDVGSPWAIGSSDGGHDAIHPELGTEADFKALIDEANSLGMEVALDYALQCSPDHPWVTEHPEWFNHRADGTIQYAENPPKKYQDIYPINFWPRSEEDRKALWTACRSIVEHWLGFGIRIFRVDNPHTKPMAFWEWLIPSIQNAHSEVIFLAEAFTRPKVMNKLAEVGFTQSYTYFAWRTTKHELASYVTELTNDQMADYFRPNFWPNTPDILAGQLRYGPPSAFRLRALLAATLAPSYGIYSGYELCENRPQSESNEEYLNSEKYELKKREWDDSDSIGPFIKRLNEIRRAHPSLQQLRGTMIHHGDNDSILAYSRFTHDRSDVILCVVNLDPHHFHDDMITVDLNSLQISESNDYEAYDELTGESYIWNGRTNFVRIDPSTQPGHIFHLRTVR